MILDSFERVESLLEDVRNFQPRTHHSEESTAFDHI